MLNPVAEFGSSLRGIILFPDWVIIAVIRLAKQDKIDLQLGSVY
jgi:hypothetical protein